MVLQVTFNKATWDLEYQHSRKQRCGGRTDRFTRNHTHKKCDIKNDDVASASTQKQLSSNITESKNFILLPLPTWIFHPPPFFSLKPLPLDLSLAPLPLSPQSCSLRKMVKDQVTQVSKPQYCNLGGYCDVGRGGGCTAKAVLF